MQGIKDYIFVIAASGVMIALVETFIGSGGIGKSAKFISALFMVIVLISPLTKLSALQDVPEIEEIEKIEISENVTYSKEIIAEIEKGIKEEIVKTAAENGVDAKIKSLEIKSDKDGNIFVSQIILLNEDNTAANIGLLRNKLKEKFGEELILKLENEN